MLSGPALPIKHKLNPGAKSGLLSLVCVTHIMWLLQSFEMLKKDQIRRWPCVLVLPKLTHSVTCIDKSHSHTDTVTQTHRQVTQSHSHTHTQTHTKGLKSSQHCMQQRASTVCSEEAAPRLASTAQHSTAQHSTASHLHNRTRLGLCDGAVLTPLVGQLECQSCQP